MSEDLSENEDVKNIEDAIKDIERRDEEIKRMVKELEKLRQEIKDMIDRKEISKPESGNLVKDVLEAIEKYVISNKPHLKVSQGQVSLQGFSGNWWRPDIVVEDTSIEDEVESIKAIIECKEVGEETSYSTYRSSHIPRAYMELADLRNWEKTLRFVVFSKRLDKGKRGFDFDALFSSINAKIIDWSDKYEWFLDFILDFMCHT